MHVPDLSGTSAFSDRLFETAFTHAAIGMALVGVDGSYLKVNHALCDIVGYGEAELTALNFQAITHACDIDADLNLRRKLIAGEFPNYQMEKRYLHKNGAIIWVLLSVSLVHENEGELDFLVVQVQDITTRKAVEAQRKQTEEQLRVSEQRFHDVTANIPGAVYQMVWYPDRKPHFKYLSDTTILGLDPQDVVKDSAVFIKTLHPDYRDKYIAQLAECSRTLSYRYWEGKNIDVHGNEVWIAISATPQPLENGAVLWTGMLQDVTERKQLQLAVEHSEQLYRSLVQSLDEGVMLIGAHNEILACNESAEHILGMRREEIMQRSAADSSWGVVDEDNMPLAATDWPVAISLRTGQPTRNVTLGVRMPGGELRWIIVNVQPIAQPGQILPHMVVASFHDVTEQKALTRELETQAQTDFLTGACNRRHLLALAGHELLRAERYKAHFSLLLLDIDHFKRINDCYGHLVGDLALQHLVRTLKKLLREVDIIGRMGGEEFLVLLPETSEAPALEIAERLRQKIAADAVRLDNGEQVRFTVSIGSTTIRTGDNLNAIIRRADEALYRAKAQGRNQVCAAAPA